MIVFRKSKLFADNDVNNEKKNDNSGLILGLGLAGSGVLGAGSVIGANKWEEKKIKNLTKERDNKLKKIHSLIEENDAKLKEDLSKVSKEEKEVAEILRNSVKNDSYHKIRTVFDTDKHNYSISINHGPGSEDNPLSDTTQNAIRRWKELLGKVKKINSDHKENYDKYQEDIANTIKDTLEESTKALKKADIIRKAGIAAAGVGALGSGLYYYNKKK